jgi:hypothetical protein
VNPWYNAFVEKAIVDRDMAFRFWRSYRTLELQEIYKRWDNRVHCLVRQAKREYMATFLSLTLPAKTLWKDLDSFGVNSYFASANVPGQTVRPSLNEESDWFSSSAGFDFSNVTRLEVFDAFFKIKSSCG